MAKKIAALKQTSGEGFNFEDKVLGYFLIHLLNGTYPFNNNYGAIQEIGLQKRSLGYLLDDLIIITKSSTEQYHFAFSIKSNKQINRNGFPSDFIASCWEQIFDPSLPEFIKNKNYLGLITSPVASSVKINLDELLRWGKEKNAVSIQTEIKTTNKIKKDLYKSLKCPPALKKKLTIPDSDSSKILGVIIHLEFDFLSNISNSNKTVLRYCRESLSSSNLTEAEQLWIVLLSLASRYRINGSDVSRPKLIRDLNFRFSLKEYPDFKSDIQKIISYTSNNIISIRDVFSNDFHLEREIELKELSKRIETSSALAILGRSGSGKSALLKNWTTQNIKNQLILWINSNSFEKSDFADFENSLRLDHGLEKLFSTISNKSTVIIDGIDAIVSETGFNNFVTFLKILINSEGKDFWRIIISCQSDDWNRVLLKINRHIQSINFEKYDLIESSSEKIVDEVITKYSQLIYLSRNKSIKPLLLNLKILDLLISKSNNLSEQEISKWIGESDIIEWYWNEVIIAGEKGLVRGSIFKKLATEQADTLINKIPLKIFDSVESIEIKNLVKERLCIIVDEKLAFFHDLFGDWARTKVLIGQVDIKQFVSLRVTSPLWVKAIRFYGLHLLEQKSLDEWRKALDDFEMSQIKVVSDSLLESILFSKNALLNLERIHSYLIENKSELLRRILIRFDFVCTLPNPLYVTIGNDDTSKKNIYSTLDRIPNVIYWIPVLYYLHNHFRELIENIPDLLAQIALKWLKNTSADYFLRKEIAELAITLAEREYAYNHSKIICIDDAGVSKKAYRAAMYAYTEYSERVKLLCLTACSRIEVGLPIKEEIAKINSEHGNLQQESQKTSTEKNIPPSISTYYGELSQAWPSGPSKSVDDDFQEVCLDNDALHPIINSNPELAKEILLALLLQEPRKIDRYPDQSWLYDKLEINYGYEWDPPMYFRGPFLYFLRRSPDIAIETIIELVNFATDRWKDNITQHKDVDLQIKLNVGDKSKIIIGNEQIFYWHRDGGNAPHPIATMLMALEKYLYELIENKIDVESYLNKILKSSRSLAFCGLLVSVGIKKPLLFRKMLKPLLEIPEFHFWELSYSLHPRSLLMMGWELEHQSLSKLAYEWHNLPHRDWNLCSFSQFLILNDNEYELIFVEIIKNWKKLIIEFSPNSSFRIFWENRIEIYNKKNYRLNEDEDGKKYWDYKEPKKLSLRNESRKKGNEAYNLFLQYPFTCRQILDGKKTIDESEFEKYLNTLMQIDSLQIKEDHIVNKATALSAGIAVLYLKFKNSLQENIDANNWCRNKLIEIIVNPPIDEGLTSEVDIHDMRWDSFCAEVLPLLWSQEVDSKVLRECVAKLATIKYYKTIEILFIALVKHKEKLGPNWIQIQNFIFFYSTIHVNYGWYEKDDNNFRDLRERLCSLFINNNISTSLLPLNSIYNSLPKEIYNNLKSLNKRFGSLDLWLIQAAYNWIFDEELWVTEKDLSYCDKLWQDFFSYTISRIKVKNAKRNDDYGRPDKWDKWVFDFLPIIILKTSNKSDTDNYWKQIIELGIPYHSYLEDFLRGWFIYYFKQVELKKDDDFRSKFISTWKEMIAFSTVCETWTPDYEKKWYHIEDIALALIGLEDILYNLWTKEHSSLIIEMSSYYKNWTDEYLIYSRCAESFINFLRQPAASSIAINGLIWVKDGYEKHFKSWDERDIIDSLSYLLNTVWSNMKDALRKDKDSFEAFKFLLSKLIEKQNPIALEIQTQIV